MVKGFIIDATYWVEPKGAKVHLFGRLENGESFLTINTYKPYFFIPTKDAEVARNLVKNTPYEEAIFEDTNLKTFAEELLTQITLINPKSVPELRKILKDSNIPAYEADIRFVQRYLMDHDIKMSLDIEGDFRPGNNAQRVNRIYEEPTLKGSDYIPELKILSIDIETDKYTDNLYCIGLYTKGFQRCLFLGKGDYQDAEVFYDEKALLERFTELIIDIDPDILIGWNVIDFDFRIIQNLYKKHNLHFTLGRNTKSSVLRLTRSFFTDSTLSVPGRSVLDGIQLMKATFVKLPDYKLSTAAKRFLGTGKLFADKTKGDDIEYSYKHDPQKLINYNLQDCRITYDLIEKSNVLNLMIHKSAITGLPINRVKSSIASLDSLYLRNLRKRGYIAPSADYSDRKSRIKGGFVRESKPGIYDNVIVVDFKSLYPSIIRTFNIDPLTFVPAHRRNLYTDLIEAPNGATFKKEEGILPGIIRSIWNQRDIAKKRKDDVASYALKTLMNSIFGVMANPACRFYNLDMANAITHFGQHFIRLCARILEDQGYEVIYGDTDSLFIASNVSDTDTAVGLGEKIQSDINQFLTQHIKEKYGQDSYMELEFEKVYRKFLMPRVRGSESGAKKRYAGIIKKDGKEKLDFVGMEFVRSDWTDLSKRFQVELLTKIFNDENIEEYIIQFKKDLIAGKFDSELVYHKNIRKPLSEYVKTTPPHVQAARKLGHDMIGTIDYVMTKEGPVPLQLITDNTKYDYEHYLEKQVKPVADSILKFKDTTFDQVLNSKQKNLFDF